MKSIKNKYLFFLLRVMKDILNPIRYSIADDLHSPKLGYYYLLFWEKEMRNQKGGQKSIVYDEDGIPLNPTYIDVKDKKAVYFPITIGQVGLAVFHAYLQSSSEEGRLRFMKFVNWFADHAQIDENLGARWLTDVSLPQYHNPGPWQSAFAQGRGISILLRAYQLTGDSRYAELAEKALISFTRPVAEGGVTSYNDFGPFYEEYTAEVPTLVLNGMIFSLYGIHDFVRVFPENRLARKLFDDGIQTLAAMLPQFNLGYWSRYNLCRAEWYPETDPSTVTYQILHATQLESLHRITQKEVFREYAEKFKKQLRARNIMRAYLCKFASLKKLKRI